MSDPTTSTAMITGASRGLGLALAEALNQAGWNLVIDSRTPGEIETVAVRLGASGSGRIVGLAGDVTDENHVRELLIAAEEMGGPDLLVNNASVLGPSPQPPLAEYPLDILRSVYETNVIAPLNLVRHALPRLRANHGVIVNVTSDAAVESYAGWGGYGSSKAALEQLSRILAAEEPQVRVYWFDPGDMQTRMHQEAFPDEDISDRPLPETRVPALIRLLEEAPPSGRYTADQFLASTEAS